PPPPVNRISGACPEMILRSLLAALVATTALVSAGHAAPKAKAAEEITVALNFPIYDRLIDPMTAAIRAELATAGTEGAFLDKRDAAGVAEFYAEQGYTPTWVIDGKLSDR